MTEGGAAGRHIGNPDPTIESYRKNYKKSGVERSGCESPSCRRDLKALNTHLRNSFVFFDIRAVQVSLTPDDGLTTRNISKYKLTIVLFYFYVKPTSKY